MSLTVGKHNFDGPFPGTDSLKPGKGMYLHLCDNGEICFLIDIRGADDLREGAQNSLNRFCRMKNCSGKPIFAVLYTPKKRPATIAKAARQLRKRFGLPEE